jgi:RNA polymerase sigma factor (TIGR02999 family)
MNDTRDLTVLLQAVRSGDRAAFGEFSAAVYQQLRVMAGSRLSREPAGHTLQPTALVHEAYLRLIDHRSDWKNRAHFFATAALHMRSILVDHARARLADKRGGGAIRVTLDERLADTGTETDFLALDEATRALEADDARTAKVIELTYFGGMTRDEIGEVLGVSVPTVDRALRFGRAWLRHALAAD